jgi:transposase InsO family protein
MTNDSTMYLPKLAADGSNWITYRDRINWTITMRGLSDHLTDDSMTQKYKDAGDIGGLKSEQRWAADKIAVNQIFSATIPDLVFIQIKSAYEPKDVWQKLKGLFEGKSRSMMVNLGKKFHTTRCGENDDIRAHLEKLADLRERLASLGRTIDDAEYTSVILGSLPPSYDTAIDSIANSYEASDKDLTPTAVIRMALNEQEKRRLRKGKDKTPDEAFTAEERKYKRKNVECYNCHKMGHYKSECWAKGGGKEGQGPRRPRRDEETRNKDKDKSKKESANAAEESPEDESWAAIVDADDADDGSKSYNISSVSADSAALTSARPEVELYDSGASRHMSPFPHRFTNLQSIPPRPITAANNRVFYATGAGDLKIDVPNGTSSTSITLKDALYAPDMGLTVVSISRIAAAGYSIAFEGKSCTIKNKSGKIVGDIPASPNGLYKVEHALAAAAAAEQVDILTVHRRLGHISVDTIRSLVRTNAVTGLHLIDPIPSSPLICDSCDYAKATRKTIRKESTTPLASSFGDEIHSDVWGPSPTSSLGGRRYYITFTDDHTRFTRLELLRTKDEALQAYKTFAAWALTQHGAKIKRLRSDRGGEYTGNNFSDFLKSEGTERRLTTHDTPQHNGVAESLNRRLLERVRAVLHHSQLPKNLWGEAIHFIVWLKNRTTTRALGKITPYEQLHGSKPDLGGVPEWGQRIWVHLDSGSKLDGRAAEARWVGFDSDSTHAHRVYWQGKNSISVERNIKFTSAFATITFPPPIPAAPASLTPTITATPQPQQLTMTTRQAAATLPTPPTSVVIPAPPSFTPTTTPSTRPPPLTTVLQTPPPATDSGEEELPDEDEEPITPKKAPSQAPTPAATKTTAPPAPKKKAPAPAPAPPQPTRKSARLAKSSPQTGSQQAGSARASGGARSGPSQWYHPDWKGPEASHLVDDEDYVFLTEHDPLIIAAAQDASDDPKSVSEARSRSDWPLWKAAMDIEMGTLENANTWTTVLRPAGKNIIGSKWVFRIKRKDDGAIDKHKARLVARGFTQIFGVDYFDTYSPVAKMASVRSTLAMAARFDWDIESFDFNGAYLNGTLDDDEELYMHEPPGYESQGEPKVKRLHKSLYGLKQAGRKWYDTLTRALTDLGFCASSADPGVFLAKPEGQLLILAIHVDDCILTGSSPELIAQYKSKLNDCYALTDLGPIHWLLGIKITRDRPARTISLSQTSYIDSIISRFGLGDAKSYSTPMVPGVIHSRNDCPSDPTELDRMKKTPYREAIGSLMYASVATRPDITYAVSALSRFLDNPGSIHWEAAKRVFRYLSGTRDFTLTYGEERHDLIGYTDADGATHEHRHAISGYAFLVDGGAISWQSRKQELVTLSTAEAEYVAATHAAKEAIWLRRLIFELFSIPPSPTTLFCDNQAAIKLAIDDNYHARTKHIDIRFHFIRQTITDGALTLIYCPTDDMTADILTKSLPKWKVSTHVCTLGLRRV